MAFNAWALGPEELRQAGVAGNGDGVFREMQRPWRWTEHGPRLGHHSRLHLNQIGIALPEVRRVDQSVDGTRKVLFAFGSDAVEAVHMPRQVATERVTLCISSQVGCAMGCTFCKTARLGWKRHLSAGELVAQVLMLLKLFGPRHPSDLTLVFMGMGEPLHNFDAVARAVEILGHPSGLCISPRRITVSTSGLIPELERFSALPRRPYLAISLNSAQDDVRKRLMPIARRYPISKLRDALLNYPVRAGERILIEYVLLDQVNDTAADARALAEFVRGIRHHINLIPFNGYPGAAYAPPNAQSIEQFVEQLRQSQVSVVTVRQSRGSDIQSACGQLAAPSLEIAGA